MILLENEIEIELKNFVTEQEFNKLVSHFHLDSNAFIDQTNYYFDTNDFQLKAAGSALRIRQKDGTYTFTLKKPNSSGEGMLETHESLDCEIAEEIINGRFDVESDMLDLLKNEFNIEHNSMRFLGSLRTSRAEIHYLSGLLVFDHSVYLGHEDYEIEYEIHDIENGKRDFNQLLARFNIPLRETPNKIRRFFQLKNRQI